MRRDLNRNEKQRAGIGVAATTAAATACLILSLAMGLVLAGCEGIPCGYGTYEKDGECVPADVILGCSEGFTEGASRCVATEDWQQRFCGPDTKWDPDTGTCKGTKTTPVVCDKKCPEAQGGTICLSGRVYRGTDLMTKSSGTAEAIGTTDTTRALVKVYDPIAFVSNPSGTEPLATTNIYNAEGCFLVTQVDIPIAGFFAIAIDDSDSTADEWAFAALGETPTTGKNSVDLKIPAIDMATVDAWEEELDGVDLDGEGVMILWFRDLALQQVEGVTPTQESVEPPWDGSDLYYFDADITAAPYFDDAAVTAKKTTASGLVGITTAPVKTYGGSKSGCTIETGLGGSAPGTIFFRILDVSGC